MILSFKYNLGPNTVFTKEAAASLIGKPFNAKIEDRKVGEGKVIDAKVIEHGHALDLMIEWPDDSVAKAFKNDFLSDFDFSI